MSGLAVRAELAKLRQLLGIEAGALRFLAALSETELRQLRIAAGEHLFDQQRALFRRLAAIAAQLPTAAPLLARLIGPLLTARIVGEMPARRAALIAVRVPPAYLAEIAAHVDPRRVRDLIRRLPVARLVEVALALLRRRDHATLGRFVDFVSDEAVQAVLEAVPDEAELLRIAFYMDSRKRVDHVVRLLPPERRRRAVLLALDADAELLDEILSLVISVGYALQRELGDLAAAQDERVLERIVRNVHDKGLWGDLLPVVASLSEASQRKVANLAILRERPEILAGILHAADAQELWRVTLPLVERLDEPMRDQMAAAAGALSREAMTRAAHATLVCELWEPMLDLVRRMSLAQQCEFAAVLGRFRGVDPELDRRVIGRALALGLGPALAAAGIGV